MTDFDSLLNQPMVRIPPYHLDRMPRIADANTGELSNEFKQLFEQVCGQVVNNELTQLYHISDKSLSKEEFSAAIKAAFGKTWDTFVSLPQECKGIDVQINTERLRSTHSYLIGGIYVLIYLLEDYDNELKDEKNKVMKMYRTELLFTYKDTFRIVSAFAPMVEVEE